MQRHTGQGLQGVAVLELTTQEGGRHVMLGAFSKRGITEIAWSPVKDKLRRGKGCNR